MFFLATCHYSCTTAEIMTKHAMTVLDSWTSTVLHLFVMGATTSGGVTFMRVFSSLIPSTCFISHRKLTHNDIKNLNQNLLVILA